MQPRGCSQPASQSATIQLLPHAPAPLQSALDMPSGRLIWVQHYCGVYCSAGSCLLLCSTRCTASSLVDRAAMLVVALGLFGHR